RRVPARRRARAPRPSLDRGPSLSRRHGRREPRARWPGDPRHRRPGPARRHRPRHRRHAAAGARHRARAGALPDPRGVARPRAGATILTGLVVGLDRRAATEFSFFLALPTMYAACLFALWKSRHDLDASAAAALAVGFITAFVSALVVIRALLRFVQTHSLR